MTSAIELAPPLTPEEYAHCFLTFRKHSTEWLATLKWCQEILVPELPSKPSVSVLSVGTGNGDFDQRLIPVLQTRQNNLDYVMLEPNATHCSRLEDIMASLTGDRVRLEIKCLVFEDFIIRRPFDLVHLTHCLYYIPDRLKAIKKSLEAIGPDGLVLIFHQTPWGIDEVQKKFLKRVKGSDQEKFSSRDIQKLLERCPIKYHMEELQSHIDITDCFQPGSSDGEALLSFFLECDIRGLNPVLKQEVLEFLYKLSYPQEDRRLLYHPVAVFRLKPAKEVF